MAGRPKPTPLSMREIEWALDSAPFDPVDWSPMGTALMARKAAAAGAAPSPMGTALMARKAETAGGKAGRVGEAVALAALAPQPPLPETPPELDADLEP